MKVIATSRAKLNVGGETLMTIPGLETEWEDPEEARQASGVELFVEAATRADSSFVFREADLEPLGRILQLVDGMPLGIELAAAWVDVLPIDDIADEIAKSLDFLATERGAVPDRHRSMRAVFDYSWSMLSDQECGIFLALSVFRDGFTREAAEVVAGASIRSLAGLVSKSLVLSDRESGRFAIHELLRQYAEAALVQDETAEEMVKDIHAGFFADQAAQASTCWGRATRSRRWRSSRRIWTTCGRPGGTPWRNATQCRFAGSSTPSGSCTTFEAGTRQG